jgi:hypothetical protein
MREKYTPKSKFDTDILYTCDYWDYTATIKIFWDKKALFCDHHLIYKSDDIEVLQMVAKFYALWYNQGRNDREEEIKDKLFSS